MYICIFIQIYIRKNAKFFTTSSPPPCTLQYFWVILSHVIMHLYTEKITKKLYKD